VISVNAPGFLEYSTRIECIMKVHLHFDKYQLSNYRPISNLSLVSVKSSNVLLNLDLLITLLPIISLIPTSLLTLSSTETALLYIHDHSLML